MTKRESAHFIDKEVAPHNTILQCGMQVLFLYRKAFWRAW